MNSDLNITIGGARLIPLDAQQVRGGSLSGFGFVLQWKNTSFAQCNINIILDGLCVWNDVELDENSCRRLRDCISQAMQILSLGDECEFVSWMPNSPNMQSFSMVRDGNYVIITLKDKSLVWSFADVLRALKRLKDAIDYRLNREGTFNS